MPYQPSEGRVIIRKVKESTGSFVVPKSTGQEDKAIGEIIALPEAKTWGLKLGDKIVYDEFNGSPVPGEEDQLIIDVNSILAKHYVHPDL
jgi:co-chaperonin GroES (HSP10)